MTSAYNRFGDIVDAFERHNSRAVGYCEPCQAYYEYPNHVHPTDEEYENCDLGSTGEILF